MALQGNPWKCVCQNTWLARWLLRWMRETLQLHTSVVERGQNVQSIVRTITCQTPVDPRSVTSAESGGASAGRAQAAGSSIVGDQLAAVASSPASAAFQHQSLVDINPDNTCRKGAGHSSSSRPTATLTAVAAVIILSLRTTSFIL